MKLDPIPAHPPEHSPTAASHAAKATDARPAEHTARAAREKTARLILGGDGSSIPEFKRYTLSIRMVENTNRIVVHVIDPETNQVVRSVPPEDVVRALREHGSPGALVDREA